MSEQDNVAVVRRAYENFKGGQIDGILDSLTDDVDWRLPEIEGASFSGGRSGRESVGGFFSQLAESQDSVSFEPREFVAQGDKVVTLGHYAATTSTGGAFDSDFVMVFTVQGGRVVRFQEFLDVAALNGAFASAPTHA